MLHQLDHTSRAALSRSLSVSATLTVQHHGTGHVKAGLNYAMSLHAHEVAHANGFDENMFLDPATRTYVEETGGANFLFVTKDGEAVTLSLISILPSLQDVLWYTLQSIILV